ncbi:hypothetical protein [Natrinema thermotolerans]
MPGNPLHAEVTADSGDYVSAVEAAVQSSERLSDKATETAAAMHLLQGRTEKAGNEAMQAGAKAGASSSGFSALAGSAGSTTGSFSALSAVTTGTLIPSMIALSSVMAPLLAAMGGFVTVAGSIAGVGLIGFLGAAATNGEQLKSTFNELTSTFRSEFAPVFDVFAGVLDRLMQRLTAIIPELVPAQEVVRQIAGQFEQLGQAIIGVLPAFTQMAVELTSRFLPAFVEWTQGILPKLPGMLQSLIPIMLQVGETLGPLAASVLAIAPTMTEFGMTVLELVTPALKTIVGAINGAMGAVNGLDKGTAKLVTTLTILSPILAKIGLAVAGLSTPVLAVAGAIGTLALAFKTDFGGIRTIVQNFGSDLRRVLGKNVPALVTNTKKIIKTLLPIVEPVFRAFSKMLSVALVNAIDLVVSSLTALSQLLTGDFKGAFQTMSGFLGRWKTRVVGLFSGFAKPITTALNDVAVAVENGFQSAIERGKSTLNGFATWIKDKFDIVGAIRTAFDNAGKAAAAGFEAAFNRAIPSELEAGGGNIPGTDKELPSFTIDLPQLDTGGYIEEGGVAQLHAGERVVQAAEVDRDGGVSSDRTAEALEKVASKLDGQQQAGGTVQIEINSRRFRELFEAEFQRLGREADL